MKVRFLDFCPCGCDDKYYAVIESKKFKFKWFASNGYWFIYIHLGKKWCRFSNAGFIKGEFKE